MRVKISVIVPIYNMERFILHTVTCLKNQDMKEIEFILINDGSTDRTLEILEEHVKEDARFRVISMENHGYGYACNYGISQACGEYVAIYEPDDVIEDDFYSTLADTASRFPHADVIRYNGFYKNIEGNIHKLYTWKKEYTEQILDKYQMKRFWRSHPSVYNGIYRTEFLRVKNIVFCESPGASFQDVTFMISLFYSNPSIYIINKTKYYYTIHDNQSINNVSLKVDSVIKNWNDEYEWMKRKGIHNESFFLYRICMQANSILNKVHDKNIRNKLYNSLHIFFYSGSLDSSVATFKQKCICRLLFIRTFIWQVGR